MSAVCSCADSAAAESFFGVLKREWVNRQQYQTRAEARADIIEMYLRYRSVRPERLDAAMARLDAAVNTLITPACSPTV